MSALRLKHVVYTDHRKHSTTVITDGLIVAESKTLTWKLHWKQYRVLDVRETTSRSQFVIDFPPTSDWFLLTPDSHIEYGTK